MGMTRKHFDALAEMVRNIDMPTDVKREIALEICRVCRNHSGNPNFRSDYFMEGCGMGSACDETIRATDIRKTNPWFAGLPDPGVDTG